MRILLRILGTLVALLLAVVVAAWWALSDPNQLKPQLTTLIEDATGVPVRIDGDLAWRLFPPLTLRAEGLSADHEDTRYELERLALDLDLRSVIANQDLEQWQVRTLTLTNLVLTSEGARTEIDELKLTDFAFDQLADFEARLTQHSADGEPLPVAARGKLLYEPTSSEIQLKDTRVETDMASGLCNIDATIGTGSSYQDPPEALIPVSIWRSYDWVGECLLDDIELDDQTFKNVRAELSNDAGNSTTTLTAPEFFGGTASAKVDIDAQRDPVAWRVEPSLTNVDSQALMRWLDKRLTWAAPLAYGGTITMTGNTTEELVSSMRGQTRFDGGKGKIDVTHIKRPLLALATLLKEDESIRKWPEIWEYERLLGDWTINGTSHELDLALDNLTAAINGDYDPLSDALDMQIDVLFEDNPGMHSFDVNPLLVGIPIPLRCRGTLEAPKCTVDQAAAQRIVASALTAPEGSELRGKIDEKIDEHVPEEYRETARGLLDAFGRALQNQDQRPQQEERDPEPDA